MKKIIFIIFAFLFIKSVFSQKIIETEFMSFDDEKIEMYNLYYNEATNTYVYTEYDGTENYYLISNKGNSRRYNFISTYDIKFDKKGNYYVIANKNQPGTEDYKYYFLVNGIEKAEFEFIWYSLFMNNDIIYFIAEQDSLKFLVSYNTNTNKFNYGKKYKQITLSKIDEKYKYEPYFEIGFTKEGEPYYIAEDDNYSFLVIGNKEQKKYNGIRDNQTFEDLKGNICYNAIIIEGEKQYGCFVQGRKEFKRFTSTLNPVIFKPDNTPVYVGSNDEYNEYTSQFIIEGETPGKVYNGYIYNLVLTPGEKIAYIATDSTPEGKYYSRVVINGKEGKKYDNIYQLKFLEDDTPVYIAAQADKELLVIGNKEYNYGYNSIINMSISPKNTVVFLGMISSNDNNQKEEYYIHIGDKKFGPYFNIPYAYTEGMVDFVTFNEKGNFAFIIFNENEQYTIISDYFKCDYYQTLWDFNSYKNDFYYIAGIPSGDEKISYQLYKNGKAISNSYDNYSYYSFNEEKGQISFIGLQGNKVYYVKVDL